MIAVVGVVFVACFGPPSSASPARAKAEIGHAYSTLFNFADHSVKAKTAVIHDGAKLRKALTQALSSSLAQEAAGATVLTVELLSSQRCGKSALPTPCAKVTYNLLNPTHTPLFATPSIGYAVKVDGRWLVAKSTICGLLGLFYSVDGHRGRPPGC